MKITKDQKAITLIALIITIIVLLVLAGVALSNLTGNNSIIDNANYAVQKYNASAGNDQKVLNQVEELFARYMGESANNDATGDNDDNNTPTQSYTITYNANGGTGTMEEQTSGAIATNAFTAPEGKQFKEWNTSANGNGTSYEPGTSVSSNTTLYAIWYDPLSTHVQPGDYITYNPELGVATADKATLLNYTSPVGTLKIKNSNNEYVVNEEGTTYTYNGAYNLINANGVFTIPSGYTVDTNGDVPGNGYGEQSFTAIGASTVWRVLSVTNGIVKIIPETPILKTNSDLFDFFSIRGLRGYKNAITELNNISSIFGHGQGANGAASITIEEVNALTGYTPTPPATATAIGSIGSWYITSYGYQKNDSLSTNIKSMIFKNNSGYWIASNCVGLWDGDSDGGLGVSIRGAAANVVTAKTIWTVDTNGNENNVDDGFIGAGVMPVVSLKPNAEKLGGTGAEGTPWVFQVTE